MAVSKNGHKKRCVITIKMNDNLTLRWDAIRTVLLKAFAKLGARDFSDQQWPRLLHEGSSMTRFEYCVDSQQSYAFFRSTHGQ